MMSSSSSPATSSPLSPPLVLDFATSRCCLLSDASASSWLARRSDRTTVSAVRLSSSIISSSSAFSMKIKLELELPRISAAAAEGDLSNGAGLGALCSFSSSLALSVDAAASSLFPDDDVEPDLGDASTTVLAELPGLARFLPVGLLPAGSGRTPAAFAVRYSKRSNARRNSASCSAGVLFTCFLPFAAACGEPRRMRENMFAGCQ
mmetsp:Transcript_23841/g.53350  ORF Transcript_23841/g.53350 Transcript_23841/m.53350 type:complete len:206 (+) Transcript_23841:179-796(+)